MSATSAREFVLDIEGMTCASCVHRIEGALAGVGGVEEVVVNLAARTATVQGGPTEVGPLLRAVVGAGYGARPHRAGVTRGDVGGWAWRLVLAVGLTVPLLVLTFVLEQEPWSRGLAWALTTPVVFVAGWPFIRAAIRAARHGTTTMDTLIALGATSAYAYSVWAEIADRHDHYFDTAAVIVTLIIVGKTFEARARTGAGDAVEALLERGADRAVVLTDGGERSVPATDLRPGDLVVVRPGEKVPADGVVREGTSWVDLSLLTGESRPVDVGPGDEVIGASINGLGRLVVFVTTVGDHTRLASIARLLERVQSSRAPIQRLADRVSAVFVPGVIALAAATYVGWATLGGSPPGEALLRSVAVLLIACPCALGLATPAAIMAGAGRAAELGVLFKGGEVFERARSIDTVLLDKTGTITEGVMTVARVAPEPGCSQDDVLARAAAVELGSEHPIGRAIVDEAVRRGLSLPDATDHEVRPGTGASAVVDGVRIEVAKPRGVTGRAGATVDEIGGGGATPVVVLRDGALVGTIALADRPKPGAAGAVDRLRRLGLRTALVSGDHALTVAAIGAEVGVDRVLGEVLPEAKVEEVERLRRDGRRVAFVGDGLNDAPVLAAADLGIAVGTGTDVALAAADVNLLGASLGTVPDALVLARRTYRVIAQNLVWAFAYNVVMIPLAMAGRLTPGWAAAAMAGSSLSVVLNALRLRRFTPHRNMSPRVDVVTGGPGVKTRGEAGRAA